MALYDWLRGEAVDANWPPASGLPFHHSAFSRKLPDSTAPSGAVESRVNASRPVSVPALNAFVMLAPGATIGKSKMRFGVPF